jgi:hypothetical protein
MRGSEHVFWRANCKVYFLSAMDLDSLHVWRAGGNGVGEVNRPVVGVVIITRRGPGRVSSQILRRSSRGRRGKRWKVDFGVRFWSCRLWAPFVSEALVCVRRETDIG